MIQLLKIPFNAGTLAGLGMFALFLILYYIGFHPLLLGQLFLVPMPAIAMVMACLRIRQQVLKGKITFRRAFYTSVITAFVSISCCCLLVYIFMVLVDHNVLESYFTQLEQMIEMYKARGVEIPMPAEDMQELRKMTTPAVATQSLFFNLFFLLSLAALIIALAIRNQKWKPGVEENGE